LLSLSLSILLTFAQYFASNYSLPDFILSSFPKKRRYKRVMFLMKNKKENKMSKKRVKLVFYSFE